jgi:hypothetical protein
MSNPEPKASALQPKMLKWGLGICTTVYVLAFPFLLAMAFVCSMLAFERPTETSLTIGIIVVVMSCVPLSVPVSIYLMWSRYFRRQTNKALIFAGLPVCVFVAMLLICGLLEALQ